METKREWTALILLLAWLAWCIYEYDSGTIQSMYDEIKFLRTYGGDVPR